MKVLKLQNSLTIIFDSEEIISDIPYTEETWNFLKENQDDESIVYERFSDNAYYITSEEVAGSNLLVYDCGAVTMPLVSEISIPKDIVRQILKAEKSGDKKQINKWVNFWTFVSMNPNEAVRDNIFWFLNKWDIQITDSGLIRAYRNVDIYQEANRKYNTQFIKNVINSYYKEKYVNNNNPENIIYSEGKSLEFYYNDIMNEGNDTPIYTDHHSHTFRIKLGQPVKMPREETDQDSTVSCSCGSMCGPVNW